jgi:wyosine [tRNA(Phe)-imidazoG37] synthetase (radical SAM superfamily)
MKKKRNVYSFSIIITQRCNCQCSYCHYYGNKPQDLKRRDISDDLFNTYMHFIQHWRKKIGGLISYRFSGGEPLVLRDRLFELSAKGYEFTRIKPYLLTNGKGINDSWIKKAKKNKISHLFISLEDPLDPDPGAPDPYETMRKIKEFQSCALPLYLGVTLVKNSNFKNIYKICKIVYEQLKVLPTISEFNYQAYQRPTTQQLKDLRNNLYLVIKEFKGKAVFNLFPYISPELFAMHQGDNFVLTELDINNKHNMTKENQSDCVQRVLKIMEHSYPTSGCLDKTCAWFKDCQKVKWLWKRCVGRLSQRQIFQDYCNFKKTINSAYYEALAHLPQNSHV